MLNRGYAYTTIISSKYHGRTLLSHLANLYPHSTPRAWQQKLDNREVTVNGVTATGGESLTLCPTIVWNRTPAFVAKAAPQPNPLPPVGPSHFRHRPLCQNTAGRL